MRASVSGSGISICRSILPERSKAGSMTEGLLVAQTTMTPLVRFAPSSSSRPQLTTVFQ